jgi:hypothetical protein
MKSANHIIGLFVEIKKNPKNVWNTVNEDKINQKQVLPNDIKFQKIKQTFKTHNIRKTYS